MQKMSDQNPKLERICAHRYDVRSEEHCLQKPDWTLRHGQFSYGQTSPNYDPGQGQGFRSSSKNRVQRDNLIIELKKYKLCELQPKSLALCRCSVECDCMCECVCVCVWEGFTGLVSPLHVEFNVMS